MGPPEFYSWSDNRDTNAQVYVQKVIDGIAQWGDDGLLVSVATSGTSTAAPSAIVATPDGGLVILYRENLGGTISVMAQRYDRNGVKLWTSSGVVVSNATSTYASVVQHSFAAMSDGGTGFIFAWADSRSGEARVYVQRVNSSGVAQWVANGVLAIDDAGDSGTQQAVAFSDGEDGIYVTGWRVLTAGSAPNLCFQHLDGSGSRLWGSTGVTIASNIEATFLTQRFPRQNCVCLSDGAMAFVYGAGTNGTSMFVRKLAAADGSTVWTTANILSSESMEFPFSVALVPTDDGGAIVLPVTHATGANPERVRARLVNPDGSLGFGPVTVYTGSVSSGARVCAVPDGSNGALLLFSQTSPTVAALAARILSSGTVQFSGVAAAGDVPTPGSNGAGVHPAPGVDGSMVSATGGTASSVTAYRISALGDVVSSTLLSDATGAGNDNKTMMGLIGSA